MVSENRTAAIKLPLPVHQLALYLAATLIVYLPLEPAVLSALPQAWYWPMRLAPDAAIGVLAAFAVLDGTLERRAKVALVGMAVIVVLIAGLNLSRGISLIDSINALRVLLRYIGLGIALWGYRRALDPAPVIVTAVLVSGIVQVLAGAVGIGSDVLSSEDSPFEAALLEAGTTGRYDRFGILMACVLLAAFAASMPRVRGWIPLLGCFAMTMLVFSNSRQAVAAAAAGLAALSCLPALPRLTRGLAVVAAVVVVATGLAIPAIPTQPTVGGDMDGQSPIEPSNGSSAKPPTSEELPRSRGSSRFSTDPNENFRLFLVLDMAPWAIREEPLLGFGPAQHSALDTDDRLEQYVEAAGTTWAWARRFTNDSNYASMLIQFGLPLTVGFVGLLIALTVSVSRRAWRRRDPYAALGVSVALAIAVAAFLGPAFETRVTSIILWTVLFTAAGGPKAVKEIQ